MKKQIIPIVMLAGMVTLFSCKSKSKEEGITEPATTQSETAGKEAEKPGAAPKTYIVTVTPDKVELGKNKEAYITLKNVKATDLSDPEGKSLGIELSYDFDLTNKRKIGESSVSVSPNDFRLELDNGTKISHDSYNSVSADAESTNTSTKNTFKIPAGAKPTALNLYFDETRASVSITLK